MAVTKTITIVYDTDTVFNGHGEESPHAFFDFLMEELEDHGVISLVDEYDGDARPEKGDGKDTHH